MQQYNEFNKNIIQKMNTIFMDSRNSKRPEPDRLSFNLTDKTDLRRKDKYIAFSNLSIYHA